MIVKCDAWCRTGPFCINRSEVWGLDGSSASSSGSSAWCLTKSLQHLQPHILLRLSLNQERSFQYPPQQPGGAIWLQPSWSYPLLFKSLWPEGSGAIIGQAWVMCLSTRPLREPWMELRRPIDRWMPMENRGNCKKEGVMNAGKANVHKWPLCGHKNLQISSETINWLSPLCKFLESVI